MLFLNQQAGATEAYLNGKLIRRSGQVSADPSEERPINAEALAPMDLRVGENLLAVRYSYSNALEVKEKYGAGWPPGPSVVLTDGSHWAFERNPSRRFDAGIFDWVGGALFMMFLSHLFLFVFSREDRSNLYFALFALLLLNLPLRQLVTESMPSLAQNDGYLELAGSVMTPGALLCLVGAIHFLFYGRVLRVFWVLAGLAIVAFVSEQFDLLPGFQPMQKAMILVMGEMFRVTAVAVWRKQEGSRIMAAGVLAMIVLFFLGLTQLVPGVTVGPMLAMTFPISVSALLGVRASRRNKTLVEQGRQIAQHAENLETQVEERTAELSESLEDLKRGAESARACRKDGIPWFTHGRNRPRNQESAQLHQQLRRG